jgi:hypothetical protein
MNVVAEKAAGEEEEGREAGKARRRAEVGGDGRWADGCGRGLIAVAEAVAVAVSSHQGTRDWSAWGRTRADAGKPRGGYATRSIADVA